MLTFKAATKRLSGCEKTNLKVSSLQMVLIVKTAKKWQDILAALSNPKTQEQKI